MAAADAASRSSLSPLAAAAQAFADAAADGASLRAVLDDADLSCACVGWFQDADEAAALFASAIFLADAGANHSDSVAGANLPSNASADNSYADNFRTYAATDLPPVRLGFGASGSLRVSVRRGFD